MIGRGFLAAALLFVACKPADNRPPAPDSSSFAASSTPSALLDSAPAAYTVPARAYDGPRITADSLLKEPVLELQGNEWVLRLPVAMARVLYDSLPGFSPFQLSGWQPSAVAYMLTRDPGAALPSLVVGDFNGDSTRDVAMEGNTATESAFLILLSKSDSVREPRIFIALRNQGTKREAETYMGLTHAKYYDETEDVISFDLKHDAVVYGWMDKAASIYYVANGVLSQYNIAD